MSTVINLFGGSGLGKSTTAALLFGEMKLQGLHCELVREYVKEWAWAGRKVGPDDQDTIYENQLSRERLYYNKLDFIVTDSPLLLGPIYQKFYTGDDPIKNRVLEGLQQAADDGIIHMNFVLQRNKEFDARGRYENETQAKAVDELVEQYLKDLSIPYHIIKSNDRERVHEILSRVL